MVSKIVLVALVMVAAAAAVPAGAGGWGAGAWGAGGWGAGAVGVNPWIPPWVATAPWYPQWVPCTVVGSSCQDCTTKVVCTKVGGMARACNDPTLPYCNAGECSATPAAGCGEADPTAPAAAAQ